MSCCNNKSGEENEGSSSSSVQPADPVMPLMMIMFQKMTFFALTSVTRLSVPDHLSIETATSIEKLSESTGLHADSLYRVLRTLSSVDLFKEDPPRHFSLTPSSELLQTNHPQSMKSMILMMSDEWSISAYLNFAEVLKTGKDAITLTKGKNVFELFSEIPEQAANFHAAMTGFSAGSTFSVIPALPQTDIQGITRLADVGGGHGLLLSAILRQFPHLKGVLFDLPEVISGVQASGHFQGLEDRTSYESGSFFERAPVDCDGYILKHIIHDWSDEKCRVILSHISQQLAKTAPEKGRVFIVEMVLLSAPCPGQFLDIEMLVVTVGGRERTADEFAALLTSAGLKLIRIVPTSGPHSIIEASLA